MRTGVNRVVELFDANAVAQQQRGVRVDGGKDDTGRVDETNVFVEAHLLDHSKNTKKCHPPISFTHHPILTSDTTDTIHPTKEAGVKVTEPESTPTRHEVAGTQQPVQTRSKSTPNLQRLGEAGRGRHTNGAGAFEGVDERALANVRVADNLQEQTRSTTT